MIEKEEGNQSYFDFPRTLKSLIPYIDYKLASNRNESIDELKLELGEKLIEKFFYKMEELIERKRISDSIKTCDYLLDF